VADRISFTFIGGDRFVVDLRQWRGRLLEEARQAAKDAAEHMASSVADQWPTGKTGNLRSSVRVMTEATGADTFQFRVRTSAEHANLYEYGTTQRHTKRGGNRGVMPKHPVWVRSAIDYRARFTAKVREIVSSAEPSIGSGRPDVTGSL